MVCWRKYIGLNTIHSVSFDTQGASHVRNPLFCPFCLSKCCFTAEKRVTPVTMARMYGKSKGKSGSLQPWKRKAPSWVKMSPPECEQHICRMAKKGFTVSKIGSVLRDSMGVPRVQAVCGQKVLRILKKNGLAPEIPEDLYHLIKKAVVMRKHLDKNRRDKDTKFRLILVESKLLRLARYYKRTGQLPPQWRYSSQTAQTLVA